MFRARCGVIFLALLACAQAQVNCVENTYGALTAYEYRFSDFDTPLTDLQVILPLDEVPGCSRYDIVGTKVRVCAQYDVGPPSVQFEQIDVADVHRSVGAQGNARVSSWAYCRHNLYQMHGALGGTRAPTPKVKPLKKKY